MFFNFLLGLWGLVLSLTISYNIRRALQWHTTAFFSAAAPERIVMSPSISAATTDYIAISTLAVLMYDYLLTVIPEIELIWRSKWNFIKVLFILSRYSAFLDMSVVVFSSQAVLRVLRFSHSERLCVALHAIVLNSFLFGIGMSEAILILRTYALWGNQPVLLASLITLLTVFLGVALVCHVLFLRALDFGYDPSALILCLPKPGSYSIIFIDFVLIMAFECIIMGLTVWSGINYFRHSRNRLAVILFKDGILYFVCMFLSSTINLVILVVYSNRAFTAMQRVMHCLFSTRIILHVRQVEMEQATTQRTLSDISFRHPD